jgi:acyl-CoA synthetase (AMP-forming)/AMP-acid ligase II
MFKTDSELDADYFMERFQKVVDNYGDNIFVYDVITNEKVTYGELACKVSRCVVNLQDYIQHSSSVGIILENSINFYLTSLALIKLNCQLFVFHPDWTKTIIGNQIKIMPCTHYVVSNNLQSKIDMAVFQEKGVSAITTVSDDSTKYERIISGAGTYKKAGDNYIHLATSGTTGISKWVPKDIREIYENMMAWAEHVKLNDKDIIHSVLPLCTANGFYITFMMPLWTGASIVMDNVITFKSTVLSIVPTILYLINKLVKDALCNEFRTKSSVRYSICGTAPLDSEQKKKFEQRLSLPVYYNYGITETLFISSQNNDCMDDKSTGLLINGVSIEVSEAGEFIVQGNYPFKNYFGGRYEGFTENGKFKTGDVGYIKDGLVYVTGRIKNIVIKGGFNIYPAEIDFFIIRKSFVVDTYTFGVPNEILGEEIYSTVVIKEDITRADAQREILEYLREQLPPYKIPTICFVDKINKTPTGKPIKEKMLSLVQNK